MKVSKNIEIVLEAFKAVERRDEQRLIELYHPEVEFHWPSSLPYGGSFRGEEELESRQGGWGQTWGPLQPTEAERRMEPRVVAANDDGEVVVLWRQRGVSPTGERFDGEALGLYQVREGKFARAQMFYFDTAAVLSFLERARREQEAAQRTVSKLADAGR
jgi:uncharacterized protein